jgi:hypothetical protein
VGGNSVLEIVPVRVRVVVAQAKTAVGVPHRVLVIRSERAFGIAEKRGRKWLRIAELGGSLKVEMQANSYPQCDNGQRRDRANLVF